MKNDYVTSHNFGYGQNKNKLKKIILRNLNDLKSYINEIIEVNFKSNIKDNIVEFIDDKTKLEVSFN